MTKNRLCYLFALFVGVVFLIINEPLTTTYAVAYFGVYALLALPLLSLIFFVLSLKHIAIDSTLSQATTYKNEPVTYSVVAHNTSFVPVARVLLVFNQSTPALRADYSKQQLSLAPHQIYHAQFEVVASYRGTYPVGLCAVVVYDFLGLFKRTQKIKDAQNLLVTPLPKALTPNLLSVYPSPFFDAQAFHFEEDASSITGIRPYVYSDGYKKIHWKASAKRNELLSKSYQFLSKESALLLMDNSPIELPLEDTMMTVYVSVLAFLTSKQLPTQLSYTQLDKAADALPTSVSYDLLYPLAAAIPFNARTPFKTQLEQALATNTHGNLFIFTKDASDYPPAFFYPLLPPEVMVTLVYFTDAPLQDDWHSKNLTYLNYRHIVQELT